MLPRLKSKSFLDDFFYNSYVPNHYDNSSYYNTPAVNIVEEKDSFKIEVAAPGLDKKDFHIELDNFVLTVSSVREESKEENKDRFTSREFNYSSFKRSFTLPRTVKTDKIDASHKDGILTITIPKKEEAIEKPLREIAIS